jgi:tetratricopeptide (TPR) repeat protein
VLIALLGFDAEYQAGQDSFNLGRYEDALAHFSRARDEEPRKPGPWRWLGRTLRVLERWDACVAASTQAVRLRPDSPLVPEVRKDIDACRAALGRPPYDRRLPPGQGALAVIADVDGAAVVVDGIAKGATPVLPMPLNSGRHAVRVEAPPGRSAGRSVAEEVDVVPGIVVDAVVSLAPRTRR